MNENTIRKLQAEFRIMDAHDLKPNFSALARKYNLDYRTVKKYYEGYQGKPMTRNKGSRLDKYETLIRQKLEIPRVTRKGVYEFLIDQYGADEIGSYSNFKEYCRKHRIKSTKGICQSGGNTRFETEPGELAEADWKENINLTSRNGEEFIVNIFHLVLKFSRYSYIELTISKDQNTVLRCLVNGFRFYGGVPKRVLFDNMSTVVDVSVKPKRINSRILQFSKDMNFKVDTCKARHAYTKGTNEARNKILDWIRVYNNDFDDFKDLLKIIDKINLKMNLEICEGTDIAPSLLYYKEKEYLSPLPNTALMERYIEPARVRVSPQQLIVYKGIRYSVDKKYIDEFVQPEQFNDRLFIYYKGNLIQIHQISLNPINYTENHYRQTLKETVKENNMNKIVDNNLRVMDQLLELRKVKIDKKDACRTSAGILAYLLSRGSGSDWIRRYIESMTHDNRKKLYAELGKILPHIYDDEEFFNAFKYAAEHTEDISKIRMNFYIQEMLGKRIFIDKEGLESISNDFREEIDKYTEELKKGWEQ